MTTNQTRSNGAAAAVPAQEAYAMSMQATEDARIQAPAPSYLVETEVGRLLIELANAWTDYQAAHALLEAVPDPLDADYAHLYPGTLPAFAGSNPSEERRADWQERYDRYTEARNADPRREEVFAASAKIEREHVNPAHKRWYDSMTAVIKAEPETWHDLAQQVRVFNDKVGGSEPNEEDSAFLAQLPERVCRLAGPETATMFRQTNKALVWGCNPEHSPVGTSIFESTDITAVFQAWQAQREFANGRHDPPWSEERSEREFDILTALEVHIRKLPATTMAEIAMKAELALHDCMTLAPNEGDNLPIAMVKAIRLDCISYGGTS